MISVDPDFSGGGGFFFDINGILMLEFFVNGTMDFLNKERKVQFAL
jgi:hypothetical protein